MLFIKTADTKKQTKKDKKKWTAAGEQQKNINDSNMPQDPENWEQQENIKNNKLQKTPKHRRNKSRRKPRKISSNDSTSKQKQRSKHAQQRNSKESTSSGKGPCSRHGHLKFQLGL